MLLLLQGALFKYFCEGEEMNSCKTRILAVGLCFALLVSFGVMPTSADEVSSIDKNTKNQSAADTIVNSEYQKYLESIADKANATEDIVIDPTGYKEIKDAEFTVNDEIKSVISVKPYDVLVDALNNTKSTQNCLVWSDNASFIQQGYLTYEVTVPADAVYNLAFTYLPLSKTGANADATDDKTSTNPVKLSVNIDGKILYSGFDALALPRMFVNDGSTTDKLTGVFRVDTLGNELTPEQREYGEFVTQYATDPVGVVADPYKIFLTAGTHTITLKSIYEPFALASIILKAPEKEISYADYLAEYSSASKYAGDAIEVEGEDAWLKSTNSLVPKTDNSSSDVTPNSPVKSALNYIGNTNWQVSGESLTWRINAPEDGLYTLGMNYKQAAIIDGITYRSIAIDNVIPFEECKNLRFDYCTNWQFKEIGDGTTPYLFYLTKGVHDITMTVTLGESAAFFSRLSEIVETIGNLYIDIVMITSDSPDPNRDYDLFRQIPNFLEVLKTNYDELKLLANDMKELAGARSNKYIAALDNMARVLNEMYTNQYTAQNYVSDYYSNYTTVCSWLYEMKTMPLSLDQIQLASIDKGFKDNKSGFFESLAFSTKRFFASFSDDFSTIGGSAAANANGTVRIWVNWGRDQAQVLSNLIQDSFTYETGIGVELEIVDASLVMGLLAGNYPDLSLHLERTQPVNLGMRGALYDLTNFSAEKDPKYSTVDDGSTYMLDYETVLKRFQSEANVPYWYNNQLFALPDTQSCSIMFYRTDIFESLGIEPPEEANNGQGWTWDNFLEASTIFQRNNMDAYVPYVKNTLNMLPMFLMQNDAEMYNEERNKTLLTSTDSIEAFTQWTNLYTKYSVEKQIDFYNRFRVGTAPLGIATYTTYTQLMQAAPEIQGRWKIAYVPGTMREDGTIDRNINGSGTGCGIVKRSDNKEGAWQFLCWWTSAQTQLRYNNNVESILGTVSRTPTANIEAFNAYSWNANDLEILKMQWNEVEEFPELPGGYYVARAVDQAYWAVLNGDDNEKDAILEWGKVADNEIARKIAEYAE